MKILTLIAVLFVVSCSDNQRIVHYDTPHRLGWENGDNVLIDGPSPEHGNSISRIYVYIGSQYADRENVIRSINALINDCNERYSSIEQKIGSATLIQYYFMDSLGARHAFIEISTSNEMDYANIHIIGRIKPEK